MAYPVYQNNGGIGAAASTDTVSIPFPSSISANDILIAQVLCAINTSFITPNGWTLIIQSSYSTSLTVALFWKRATGSEIGSETFIAADSSNTISGLISRYTGCLLSGIPYEGDSLYMDYSNSFVNNALITTNNDRLGLLLYLIGDDIYPNTYPTEYSNVYQSADVTGNGSEHSISIVDIPTAQTIPSGNGTYSRSKYYGSFVCALIPNTSSGDNLTSTNIESASLLISSSAIVQNHSLNSVNIESGNSIINETAINQLQALESSNVETLNSEIGQPSIGSDTNDELNSSNIESQNVIIDTPNISQVHDLNAEIIETANVIIAEPNIITDSFDELVSVNILSVQTVISNSEIAQNNRLISGDIETEITTVSNSSISQIHSLELNSIESDLLVISNPNLMNPNGENITEEWIENSLITTEWTEDSAIIIDLSEDSIITTEWIEDSAIIIDLSEDSIITTEWIEDSIIN